MSVARVLLVFLISTALCSGQQDASTDFFNFNAFGHEVKLDYFLGGSPDHLRFSIGAVASTANNGPSAGARFGGYADETGVRGGLQSKAVKDENNGAEANLGANIVGSDIITKIFTQTWGKRR